MFVTFSIVLRSNIRFSFVSVKSLTFVKVSIVLGSNIRLNVLIETKKQAGNCCMLQISVFHIATARGIQKAVSYKFRNPLLRKLLTAVQKRVCHELFLHYILQHLNFAFLYYEISA